MNIIVIGGGAFRRGSFWASRPAVLGSNPSSNIFLYFLVCGQHKWDQTHQVPNQGFCNAVSNYALVSLTMEVKYKKIVQHKPFYFTCPSVRKSLRKMKNIETIVTIENIFKCLKYHLIDVCWANLSNILSITFLTFAHYFTNKFEFQSQAGFECSGFLS